VNDFRCGTSRRVQRAEFKHAFENGAISKSPQWNKEKSNRYVREAGVTATRLPATWNMHPTTVRTEARVVRTGLRVSGGQTPVSPASRTYASRKSSRTE
jgi:hypothetical protein